MKETLFITGGCRSGKSKFALRFADRGFKQKVFMATCLAKDEEMRERIKKHQEARGPEWQTVEVPIALPEAVTSQSNRVDLILIDCLTMWISNLMNDGASPEQIPAFAQELMRAIDAARCSVILVSNEVGTGIVPENELARRFRDVAGLMNQKVAAAVDTVVLMVSGIPVVVKGGIEPRQRAHS